MQIQNVFNPIMIRFGESAESYHRINKYLGQR